MLTPANSTRIYFVRHGDVWNPHRIFYGRLPRFRLSPLGTRQVKATAERLGNLPLAAIYSSPLLRARQTAAVIRRAHPDAALHISRLLIEIRSSRQGESHDSLEADGWNFYEPARAATDETLGDIAGRLRRFCRRALAAHPGSMVAAVTHGDVVAVAAAMFGQRPLVLSSIRGDAYPATASYVAVELRPDVSALAIETWTPPPA